MKCTLFTEISGLPLELAASGSFLVADSMEMTVGEESDSLLRGSPWGRRESSVKVSSLLVGGVARAAWLLASEGFLTLA